MSDTTSFSIFLDTDDDGAYHIKNAPGEIQRPTLIDRGDALMVQADLLQVLHGTLTPTTEPATLLITTFQFIPTRTSRRFRSALITMRFSSLGSLPFSDPEVIDIAPKGHFSLHPTTKKVELTRAADISLHGGGGFATAGGGLKWEFKEAQETQDQTMLSGTIRLEGRDYGAKNTARWVLGENSSQRTGIPTRLQTAVLLKRKEGQKTEKFQAVVEVKAEAAGVMDRMFGRVPKDDPVIFDPGAKPMAKDGLGADIDAKNLGVVDLKSLGQVVKTMFLADEG